MASGASHSRSIEKAVPIVPTVPVVQWFNQQSNGSHLEIPVILELWKQSERLEPPQLWRQSFALADKLSLVKILQFTQRGNLVNVLVVPDSLDSGKA